MAGKRLKKRRKKRLDWVSLPGVLIAALLLMIPLSGSADAKPQSPQPVEEEGEIVPWAERLPSVAENDPQVPQHHYWEQQAALTAPVTDDYFSDAAFLGDSRTEGFQLYSGLKQGQYFHAVGATVESVFSKRVYWEGRNKVPLLDALSTAEVNKIYVMLGVNELGWVRADSFTRQYTKMIQRLQADHPDATIVLQSILPVTQGQDDKGSYVNNRRIRDYNLMIRRMAAENGCIYMNVAEAVTGKNGTLPPELSFDGVHLNPGGCHLWLDYLRTHAV